MFAILGLLSLPSLVRPLRALRRQAVTVVWGGLLEFGRQTQPQRYKQHQHQWWEVEVVIDPAGGWCCRR